MEVWLRLPQVAQELGIADSRARRWAQAFADLLPCRGSGSARRYAPQVREILAQAQGLFERGLTTEEVGKFLRQRYPATVDVVPVSDEQAEETPAVQVILTELVAMRRALSEQAAAIEEADRHHEEALRHLCEQQEAQMDELRQWLEARLPPAEARRAGIVARVRTMLRRDKKRNASEEDGAR